jgi:hypothetical protein
MVEFSPKNGKGISAKKKENNSPLKPNYFLETKIQTVVQLTRNFRNKR